jgi:hypothetical protein
MPQLAETAAAIMLGPIPTSSREVYYSPWPPLLVGCGGLIYIWIRFFGRDREKPSTLGGVVFVTFVCLIFIAYGISGLLH